MTWNFDSTQLEDLKFAVDNLGVKEAFCLVNQLESISSVPVDDLVDFQHQFSQQYRETYGCGY